MHRTFVFLVLLVYHKSTVSDGRLVSFLEIYEKQETAIEIWKVIKKNRENWLLNCVCWPIAWLGWRGGGLLISNSPSAGVADFASQ